MQGMMAEKAKELLQNGTVNRVLGWKRGEFAYDSIPAVFETAEEIDAEFIYDDFCASNLSKYLIKESRKEGKVLAFLKPCDTYSFNQLIKEHRIWRDRVYIVGIPCDGKANADALKELGVKGILGIESEGDNFVVHTLYGDKTVAKADALAERCVNCKSKKHVAYDELMGEEGEVQENNRFDMVEKLEAKAMSKSDKIEKYEFWGLVLFVGIPLPGTGAWTGSLIAALLGMKFKKAFPAVIIGILMATVIMTIVSYGLLGGITIFG